MSLNIKTPIQICQFLDQNLHLFDIPEAYYGCEPNSYCDEAIKRWSDIITHPESISPLKILWMAAWPYSQFCVVKDTEVWSDRGHVEIPRLRAGDRVANDVGDEVCAAYVEKGIQPVLKLTLKNGLVLRGTADHKVMVFNNGRRFKSLGIINPVSDRIVVVCGDSIWPEEVPLMPDGRQLTEDFAWLLGLYAGDGGNYLSGRCVVFTLGSHEHSIIERCAAICARMFGKYKIVDRDNGMTAVEVYSAAVSVFIRQLGFGVGEGAKVKARVPQCVRVAPECFVRAFVKGYMDADGHERKDGFQQSFNTSYGILRDIQQFLLHMGTYCTLKTSENGWLLYVSKEECHGQHVYAAVDNIIPDGEAEVCDITMPERHCFVANGLLVSNTGNQTLPLLYKLMYDYSERWISERSHMPNTKREVDIYQKFNMPVFSLETKHAAGEFDVIGTSLGYPPFYFNIVKQLKWSGIPIRWRDRVQLDDKYPLVIVGGSTYGNPLHWSPLADIVFVGEAEDEVDNPGIKAVFTDIEQAKFNTDGMGGRSQLYDPVGREELLHTLARKYDFLYIPRFVTLVHDPQTKYVRGFRFKYDDIPQHIRRRVVWDMDSVPCVDKAMIPLHDPTMGPGEIEIARGCPARCTFCAVSFRYGPYRERSIDYMIDNLASSVKFSGSNVAFPCSFEFGSYSHKKTLIARLLTEVTDYVDTQSMRVDQIAKDPEFTRVAGEAGMRQLVLGLEGNSQRIREFVNKGITEEQILRACENGFRAGYNKVKLYMIADLPYEDQDDTNEIIKLCEKIVNLRDSMGVSAQIRCSWTPLLVEAQTPLQWFACTLDDRKLTGVYEGMKRLGVGFSLGKKTESNYSYFTQLFHLCDDIAAEAIITVCDTLDEPYLGAVDRRTKDALATELLARGVSYKHYFCDKDGSSVDAFIFPWDFINVGTSKKYLWRLYKQAIERVTTGRNPMWKEGYIDRHGACFNGCDGCTACDPKRYPPTKLKSLWDFDDQAVSLEGIRIVDQTSIAQKIRLRVVTEGRFRYIPNITWQFIMRRAAFLTDLPIAKRTIRFSSDAIKWKNWVFGVDYCEFGLTKKILLSREQIDRVCQLMNVWLVPHGMCIQTAIVLEPDKSDIVSLADCNLYEIPVDIPIPTVKKTIDAYHAGNFWEVVMKEDQYRAGIVRERVNLKSFVRDLWAVKAGHQAKLRFMIRGKASPFDALRSLFNMREIDTMQHMAVRLDIFKEIVENHVDFFANECVECGDVIPLDLFDRAFDSDLCPVCKDTAAGIVLTRRDYSAKSST